MQKQTIITTLLAHFFPYSVGDDFVLMQLYRTNPTENQFDKRFLKP